MPLALEVTHLLNRAQTQGYVTSDARAASKVIFSLLEAYTTLRATTEKQLRQRIPTYCLSHADLVIEPEYVIAKRVAPNRFPVLRD